MHPRRPFCGQGSGRCWLQHDNRPPEGTHFPTTIATTARIALAGIAALAISLTGAAGMASAKPICETGCSQPLPTKNPRPDVKQMCWVEWGQTQCHF
ncbi:hypothetical protein ACFWAY_29005 [Rhodococcus sp. NPDC059968]|uniref:hypothetical protein n=1 Tax=Rhodococcus sp. NPDC059968 TaxID=3347017 RepID=UPI003672E5FF